MELEANEVATIPGVDKSFDVSAYELEDTATLTVQNIARDDDMQYDGKPVQVVIYSPGSKQGVRALHKSSQLAQLRMQALFRGKADKKGAEQADAERADKLTMITQGFINFPADPRTIYSNPKMIDFADQVESFFSDKSNFSKVSTPT